MKVKILLVAFAVLSLAAFSHAQNFICQINESNPTFTTQCGGAEWTTQSQVVGWVYQDRDNDGVDETDPLVALPTDPDRITYGGFSYNTFVNASATPGTLRAGGNLTSGGAQGGCKVAYLRLFLRARVGTALEYTSALRTFTNCGTVSGGWNPDGWTCRTLCAPSPDTYFPVHGTGAHAEDQYACVTLCPGTTQTVYVGPLPQNHLGGQDYVPHVTVTPGCELCVPPVPCTPATGFVVTGWTYYVSPTNGAAYYMMTITPGAVGGCICLHFDYILPVGLASFSVTELENSGVRVNWATNAETNMAKFMVNRDGVKVFEVNASNSPSGHDYGFTDENVTAGTAYTYELVAVNADNSTRVLATQSITPHSTVVTEFALHQNYPNPFNPSTKIAFDVKENSFVTLTIYNATGQKVSTLLNNTSYNKGRYSLTFDASNLTSGLYFYTIKIGNEFSATKKMLLVK